MLGLFLTGKMCYFWMGWKAASGNALLAAQEPAKGCGEMKIVAFGRLEL